MKLEQLLDMPIMAAVEYMKEQGITLACNDGKMEVAEDGSDR